MLVSRARKFPHQDLAPGIPGYTGFSQSLALRPGQKAWVPWLEPVGGGHLALREFVAMEGPQLMFALGPKRRRIPSPLVRRKCATVGLAVGSPVLVPYGTGSRYGRVAAADLEKVLVDHAGAFSSGQSEFSLYDVIPLDGSAHFGAPVVYRTGSTWKWGQLLSAGGQTSWLLSSGVVIEVAATALRPLPPRRFQAGDKVSALYQDTMRAATVVATTPKELNYVLRFDGCLHDQVRGFAQVVAPLR